MIYNTQLPLSMQVWLWPNRPEEILNFIPMPHTHFNINNKLLVTRAGSVAHAVTPALPGKVHVRAKTCIHSWPLLRGLIH